MMLPYRDIVGLPSERPYEGLRGLPHLRDAAAAHRLARRQAPPSRVVVGDVVDLGRTKPINDCLSTNRARIVVLSDQPFKGSLKQ